MYWSGVSALGGNDEGKALNSEERRRLRGPGGLRKMFPGIFDTVSGDKMVERVLGEASAAGALPFGVSGGATGAVASAI